MGMPFHPYHFNQKLLICTKQELTALGDGRIEITVSPPPRSSVYIMIKPVIYHAKAYGVGDISVFELNDYLFKLTQDAKIQEIRDTKEYAYYAYQIALRKLTNVKIQNPAFRATIRCLVTQIKAIETKYPNGLLNEVLRGTYKILITQDRTQHKTALDEYQLIINKVNKGSQYKNIGIIMMALSLAFTAISLGLLLPPAMPAGIVILGEALLTLPIPLMIAGCTFFSGGRKLQLIAEAMNDVVAINAQHEESPPEEKEPLDGIELN